MLDAVDAAAVRRWAVVARAAFAARRAELDDLNVFPVDDSDTGTNLYLTFDAALDTVRAQRGAADAPRTLTLVHECEDLARASLVTARGNSGVIFSQLIGGFAEEVSHSGVDRAGPDVVAAGLNRAAQRARAAVTHPVEGTVLTVATATAEVAVAVAARGTSLANLSDACVRAGIEALSRTPQQLGVLARAGVVDAGAAGFVLLLEALDRVVREATPRSTYAVDSLLRHRRGPASAPMPHGGSGTAEVGSAGHAAEDGSAGQAAAVDAGAARQADVHGADHPAGDGGPQAADPAVDGAAGSTASFFEVMFLLDGATEESVARMTETLDGLGDSLIVVGGPQLWNVHVHTADAGAAMEAGVVAGRPHRIRVTALPVGAGPTHEGWVTPSPVLGIVACAAGSGIAALFEEAGAVVVPSSPLRRASAGQMLEAARATDAAEVVVLPNDPDTLLSAEAAASAAAQQGLSLHVVRTASTVQGIAALAVLSRDAPVGRAVVSMTGAAAATRHGSITVAETAGLTSAGPCRAGDVLGVVGDDIHVVGEDRATVALEVVSRLLTGGGELVTLLVGADAPTDLGEEVSRLVHALRRDVEVHVLDGGQPQDDLLIGVE